MIKIFSVKNIPDEYKSNYLIYWVQYENPNEIIQRDSFLFKLDDFVGPDINKQLEKLKKDRVSEGGKIIKYMSVKYDWRTKIGTQISEGKLNKDIEKFRKLESEMKRKAKEMGYKYKSGNFVTGH